MRLIDADSLHDSILGYKNRKEKSYKDIHKTLDDILMALLYAPTIETGKQGEWIREGFDRCKCSVCNTNFDENSLFYVWESKRGEPDYCPECGARMDGGEKR